LDDATGEHTILYLTDKLLSAAGIRYDQSDHTWVVPERLPSVLIIECDKNEAHITEALVEVRAILEAGGCTCSSFVVGVRFVSIVGLAKLKIAAEGTPDR
jgi:hypothetical protein